MFNSYSFIYFFLPFAFWALAAARTPRGCEALSWVSAVGPSAVSPLCACTQGCQNHPKAPPMLAAPTLGPATWRRCVAGAYPRVPFTPHPAAGKMLFPLCFWGKLLPYPGANRLASPRCSPPPLAASPLPVPAPRIPATTDILGLSGSRLFFSPLQFLRAVLARHSPQRCTASAPAHPGINHGPAAAGRQLRSHPIATARAGGQRHHPREGSKINPSAI